MRKFFKFIGILLAVLIVGVLLAIVLLVTFVNPNRLKPLISEQFNKYTGREINIEGDLSWTFFPTLGVKVGHVVLSNPAGFAEKTFAEINDATVSVQVMPLLHGQVRSSGVVLKGMKINLIKNTKGETNWLLPVVPVVAPENDKGEVVAMDSPRRTRMGVMVSAIDISDANINYVDQQTKKTYDVKNFELHASNIGLMQPFPIKISCNFSSNTPATTGHATLNSDIAINLDKQIYSFRKLELNATVRQGERKIDFTQTGDVIVDLNEETLQWTNFKEKIANVSMTGKVNVTKLKTDPVATGHLRIEPFDLKKFLQDTGQNTDSLQVANNVKGDVDFTAGAKSVNVQGQLSVETMQAAKVKLTNINVNAHYQDGVLDLAPITANLYQGSINAQLKINNTAALPQISLQAKLVNVQAEPLLQDLGSNNQKLRFTGAGNLELKATTSGAQSNTIMQNLNGTTNFSFNNGVLIGIDINYLIDSAIAVAKQKSPTSSNTNQTNFGNLTGTAIITNGVINNKDLNVDSPKFITVGNGTINLVSQQINYALQSTVKKVLNQKDDINNLFGLPIPISIKGKLSSPTIRLDTDILLKAIAQQQVKSVTNKVQDKVLNKIQDQINKQVPGGKAGDMLKNILGQ